MTPQQTDLFTRLVINNRKNIVVPTDFETAFKTWSEIVEVLQGIDLSGLGIFIEFTGDRAVNISTQKKYFTIAAHPIGDGFIVNYLQ